MELVLGARIPDQFYRFYNPDVAEIRHSIQNDALTAPEVDAFCAL